MCKMDSSFEDSFLVSKKVSPRPPSLPGLSTSSRKSLVTNGLTVRGYSSVSPETKDLWERLFDEGYRADVSICTDNGGIISGHSNILVSIFSLTSNALTVKLIKH